jgi:hypothetical protein
MGVNMKRLLVTSLAVSVVLGASSAWAQRGNSLVPYMYCPADSPRYGYVAHSNIKWCYAGPYGSLLRVPGWKNNNGKGKK